MERVLVPNNNNYRRKICQRNAELRKVDERGSNENRSYHHNSTSLRLCRTNSMGSAE